MKALVEFVGAGPGAEDLITVRGLRALEQADLVVYAGSLVNPAHLKACKADCTCLDSASMNLGEQIEAKMCIRDSVTAAPPGLGDALGRRGRKRLRGSGSGRPAPDPQHTRH